MSSFDLVPTIAAVVAGGVAIMNGLLAAIALAKRRASKADKSGPFVYASDRKLAEGYEAAISRLAPHIIPADDGTFNLDLGPRDELGIDPNFFADLRSSLAETNRKIRQGEISRDQLITELS